MKEIIFNILQDILFFSLVEGFVCSLYFHYIFNCKKFKIYEIIIMSIINGIISQVLPPLIYQIAMILWMSLFLYVMNEYNKNFINYFKYSFKSLMIIFITESIYSMIMEYTNMFYFFDKNINDKFMIFILCIPIRLIEILYIYLYKLYKRR